MIKLRLQLYGSSHWASYLESLDFPMEIENRKPILMRFVGTLRALAEKGKFATTIQTVYDRNAQLQQIIIGSYAKIIVSYD